MFLFSFFFFFFKIFYFAAVNVSLRFYRKSHLKFVLFYEIDISSVLYL